MKTKQEEMIERIRGRAASCIEKNEHFLPLFKEEYQVMQDAGLIDTSYGEPMFRFLTIKKLNT